MGRRRWRRRMGRRRRQTVSDADARTDDARVEEHDDGDESREM